VRSKIVPCLLVLVVLAAPAFLAAQEGASDGPKPPDLEESVADGSFGLGNQNHFVPAFAFQPDLPSHSLNYHLAGYYYMTGLGNARAPLSLPAGARVTVITCYFYDNDNGASDFAVVNLQRFTYNTSSDSPGAEYIGPSLVSLNSGGYHRVFDSFDETIRYRPSLFTRRHYGLELSLPPSSEVRFRGCNVTWNRQVSTAPASATFTDVPVSHPYHQFVEALVTAGITGGCGGGLYCVNAPITRGEMAVFLAAALGLHFPF
jgi:hypothetical protein